MTDNDKSKLLMAFTMHLQGSNWALIGYRLHMDPAAVRMALIDVIDKDIEGGQVENDESGS